MKPHRPILHHGVRCDGTDLVAHVDYVLDEGKLGRVRYKIEKICGGRDSDISTG